MKAMIVREFGGPEVFEAAELAKPEVKPGHVLVRIAATSVNTVDTMIRQMGEALPLSPAAPALLGMDFAGVVESVGEGVTQYAVGDEVYGCAGGLADLPGTLAEYIVADANLVARKPENLSMREAAAIPLVGITAYEGLSLHVVFMLLPMLHNVNREAHGEILSAIADISEAGKLTPVLDEMHYDLANVADAHKRLESGAAMGKVVVDING